MTIAIQANLVQLKVADAKRLRIPTDQHEIQVPPPGKVDLFRETLIERKTLLGYTGSELHVRLREVWGQYCMMRWLLHMDDSGQPMGSVAPPVDASLRCLTSIEGKFREVHALLWKFRHEQDSRLGPPHESSNRSAEDRKVAARIPAEFQGKSVERCTHEELLIGACEYAGMLAALRWALEPESAWAAAGCMDVADHPFAC